jgi:hypothetical protein
MSIQSITADDLRHMEGKEALILQGCGGDLTEWVDGINDLFTKEGILLEGTKFHNVYSFAYEGLTCLLYPMDDTVKLNIGKLAIWRLATHDYFGGTWLSDFVPNRLGGFARDQPTQSHQKPDCPLIGQDGNLFFILGMASNTLKEHGLAEQAEEMLRRAHQSGSYYEALGIVSEYVNITSVDDPCENLDEGMVMG